MTEIIVITKVPDTENPGGNLAMPIPAYLHLPYENDSYTPLLLIELRTPVFYLGEIIIANGGREIGGVGRKPSKWEVDYETFSNVDEAIRRSREVTGLG